ncbi:hypothetical protein Clacol_006006 [Clathrus columnatus]|uniref:Cyclase n=1 Tax=Clathrus columnatus TaxID=1419009 RepID=A0AAV5AF57_9AGAM|nr:hypothetical protein Clacol_006006 [Clathrus columnatus]
MERLQSLKSHLQTKETVKSFEDLPSFHELPYKAGLPGCAWDVWGQGDELGTVNMLTDEVVAQAAKEEIKVKVSSITKGLTENDDPTNLSSEEIKLGIHSICGRGVLIDLVKYYTDNGKKPLPYDPWSTHAISVTDIEKAAKQQGVKFRQADILVLRVGFMQKFNQESKANRDSLRTRPETLNNHFAAIASDQPALEAWPVGEGEVHLHQTILGLWGMPIGEFFDLEKLAKHADRTGRYTFFFSSWPLNVLGGVASPPNAAAIF